MDFYHYGAFSDQINAIIITNMDFYHYDGFPDQININIIIMYYYTVPQNKGIIINNFFNIILL